MRLLDEPKTRAISVIQQSVTRVVLEVGHVPDQSGPGVKVDPLITALSYWLGNYKEDGKPDKFVNRSVYHADWPVEVVEAVRTLLTWADTDAETNNLVDPGVRTDAL